MAAHTEYGLSDDLRFAVKDRIGWLTVHRPERLNALARSTKKELCRFFQEANERDDFKVVILTGAGDKAFCAGTDLKDIVDLNGLEGERMFWTEHRLNDAIRHCNKPVIAAVNGYALGSGCLLAIACDYSVVSASGKLGFPEMKVGVPSAIEIALLPKLVGLAKTREMVYFGEMLDAQEALRCGLVNRVVPPDEVLKTAEEIARKFMELSPTALRLQKEIIQQWIETDFDAAVVSSIYATGVAFSTGEPHAAMRKFIDKTAK